ncbi:MAG: hypothetical protein C6P37_13565 [Caldibacillus debilis]|uniref:Uncharacterized protein n=1 Tax=Caldibacillus debilis TaxID=301148 RepID=A0A3E0K1A1_9BACI|nr:MAG: hypothetical protein C6P37_13565 [Caldibacillus debilis]
MADGYFACSFFGRIANTRDDVHPFLSAQRWIVRHFNRMVQHPQKIFQQPMGLFNIFGDSSIIFGFMFILNKNLSDIKEKITIILEKTSIIPRKMSIIVQPSMANTRFRISNLAEMKWKKCKPTTYSSKIRTGRAPIVVGTCMERPGKRRGKPSGGERKGKAMGSRRTGALSGKINFRGAGGPVPYQCRNRPS